MSKRVRGDRARMPSQPPGPDARSINVRPSRTPFIASIGLSAFLLFTLELLAGRVVLPVFGGSPGVWTTALALFTGILFVGYLYAHFVATRFRPRRGGLVHLAVAALAVVLTLLAPQSVASLRLAGTPEVLNVLLALLLIAGAPAFLLASTTPLLSAWFSARGGDPWWLYAVSNAASLLALLAYPFVLEPNVPLSTQRAGLAVTLVVYAVTLVVVVSSGRRPAARGSPASAQEVVASQPLTRRRELSWLFAASIPAGLLSATTNFIATDLVSAPLLWIGPLGIYLASFVVAFSRRGRRTLPFVEFLVPAAATLLWIPFVMRAYLPVAALLLIELVSFAVLAIAIHGRLALDRPDDCHLTRFYLLLSAGGLLATASVALVAPLVFSAIYEYPLLIVAAIGVLALLSGPTGGPAPGDRTTSFVPAYRSLAVATVGRLLPYCIVGGLVLVLVAGDPAVGPRAAVLLAVGAVVIGLARSPALLAGGTAIAVAILALGLAPPALARVRTFFGVIEIRAPGGPAYAEYSGQTLHGAQFTDSRSREPTTYYVRSGPLGGVMDDLRARTHSASIGVVGLGTGTIAAYAQRDDTLTFFEINQAVVDLAENGPYFTYLRESAARARIVLGDARLSLDGEPDSSLDLLVLDAFSSDAVPAHLLTREAVQLFMRKLRPTGILAFHVSNRYYNLANAVAATAQSAHLGALRLTYQPGEARTRQIAAYASDWVVVGLPADVNRFAARGWSAVPPGTVLTDDFSDLLRTLQAFW